MDLIRSTGISISMPHNINSQLSGLTNQFRKLRHPSIHLTLVIDHFRILHYPYLYVVLIGMAEMVTAYYMYWGGVVHFAILVALFLHSAFIRDKPLSDLLTAMSCAPLIRVLSLSTPLEFFSQISWFAIISIPIFITAFTIIYVQGLSYKQVFLSRSRIRYLPLETGIIILAFGIGLIEYHVLEPSPLADFNATAMIAPALILIVSTGFLEELVFRGLMQQNALRLAGLHGIIFVSVLFGTLHVTNMVFLDVVIAASAGFLFALVVRKTGSIWAVSLAHGVANITLFLIAPYWFD